MLREMGELLDRYTEQRPLLLVTEDLHWSDRATLQLIDYVARRRGRARLMWLSSFRLAEVVALDHPLNPLRHELRLQRLCQEVVLDPFSETEVADYIAQRSASLARDEAFVRALHERTDGVPLFVSSVITEVMERTTDDAAVEARLAAVAVPENLAAIIDHYIARLGNDPRALLAAAAVCGVEFRVDTVALALEREVASVADACEALAREQVWLSAPRAGDGDEARRAALRVPARAVPPGAVRPHGALGPHPPAPQGRRCPRTGAFGRRAGDRSGVGDALRPRAAADDRAALLRRGGGSGAAALQPGLVPSASPSAPRH